MVWKVAEKLWQLASQDQKPPATIGMCSDIDETDFLSLHEECEECESERPLLCDVDVDVDDCDSKRPLLLKPSNSCRHQRRASHRGKVTVLRNYYPAGIYLDLRRGRNSA